MSSGEAGPVACCSKVELVLGSGIPAVIDKCGGRIRSEFTEEHPLFTPISINKTNKLVTKE